jgi:glyoxylase-like metal-dependent hydrolase (beta-lactamase superfamily II)
MAGAKLYVLSNGWIENDVALNVLLANQATAADPHKPAGWHRVPSLSLLIEHPRLGWILVDTGSHPDALNGVWPTAALQGSPIFREPEDMLDARLAQVGLTPADIDWVILTHLHLDHAGGLRYFSGTKAGARVVCHEIELKQALYSVFKRNEPLVNAYLRADFVDVPGIMFETVEGDVELADDLHLLWLPGHTAGLLGFMLHLEHSGTIIYMSDAAYVAANYGPPARLPGILYDSVACLRSIERVRWLERRYNATVIFGHDPAQFATLKQSPAYYD